MGSREEEHVQELENLVKRGAGRLGSQGRHIHEPENLESSQGDGEVLPSRRGSRGEDAPLPWIIVGL